MHQYITLSEITVDMDVCVFRSLIYEIQGLWQSPLESDSHSWLLSCTLVCFSLLWMFAFTSGANAKVVYYLLTITLRLNYNESMKCPCWDHCSGSGGCIVAKSEQMPFCQHLCCSRLGILSSSSSVPHTERCCFFSLKGQFTQIPQPQKKKGGGKKCPTHSNCPQNVFSFVQIMRYPSL